MKIKTSNAVKKLALGFALGGLAAFQAGAIVAYDFPTTLTANQTAGPFIMGNEFVVNSSIQVTAVGAFDPGASGFGSSVPVAMYQLSGADWVQVAGTLETFSGTAGTLVGDTRFQNLAAPVILGPGTYAIVAANENAPGVGVWNSLLPPGGSGTPTFNSGGGLISMNSPELAFATFSNPYGGSLPGILSGVFGNTSNPGIPTFAGPTFEFAPVPEAASFAVAGVGLLGLIYIGRCYTHRRKLV